MQTQPPKITESAHFEINLLNVGPWLDHWTIYIFELFLPTWKYSILKPLYQHYTNHYTSFQQYNTRSPTVARTANRTGCQWPIRSSKVDNFHVVWKPICDFLSM